MAATRYGVFRRARGWRQPIDMVLHDYQAGVDLLREECRPSKDDEGENRWEQWHRFRDLKAALVRGGAGAEQVRRELS